MQRALGTDWMVSVNYVGNNVIHMNTSDQPNPGVYMPGATLGNLPQRRVLYLQNPQEGQYYGKIDELKDDGTSSYHAGHISIQRRRSAGLTLQANYTWSHCISDYLDAFVGGPAGRSYMVPGNRRLDRASCGSDLRHSFNTSTVWATPSFASNRVLAALLGGWQLSGIVRLSTGTHLTPVTGVDGALTGQQDQRPNQVLADIYHPDKNNDVWLNTAAYRAPTTGTYGNAGRLSAIGPGNIRIDMGLTRTFQIRENQTIQLRAEAFNMPNHVNPGNPTMSLNNQNFGKILSAGDPRLMQLGLKYSF